MQFFSLRTLRKNVEFVFRRKFIKTASGTALAGLVAGCGGGGGGNGGGGGGGEGTTTAGEETGTAETETAETGTAETETAETETAQETTAGGALDWSETLGQTPQGLEVANTQLTRVDQGDAGARLTGVVRNTGSQSYEELEVQATLFDDSDDVLGTYFDNTEGEQIESFGPDQQWEFSIDFPRADLGQVARYRVDVDAEIDDSVFDAGNGTGTATGTGTTTTATTTPSQ